MIKQITEKSIGRRIRFHFLYSKYKWLFFRSIEGEAENVLEFARKLEKIQNDKLPEGIYTVDIAIDNIFQIQFNETEITEEKVIEFAKSFKL